MNKILIIGFAIFVTAILSACATTTDVANIQAQITDIKHDVRELFKATMTAKYAAMRANLKASEAAAVNMNVDDKLTALNARIIGQKKQSHAKKHD